MLKVHILCRIINPAHVAAHSQNVHREKSKVKENERANEMNFAKEVIQFPAKHFWKPVINPGKRGEHTAAKKHVMNVTHNKISVVNKNIHSR